MIMYLCPSSKKDGEIRSFLRSSVLTFDDVSPEFQSENGSPHLHASLPAHDGSPGLPLVRHLPTT